jgi:magnesium chelatase family protein
MHATIYSATTIGIQAHRIAVEVDVSLGLVNFYIVGLADTAIKESTKRVQTALKNSGIRLPSKKITVNLAPADLRKEGTLFDLPIALGVLIADQQIRPDRPWLEETIFLGELSLDGAIGPIKGALAIAYDGNKNGKKRIVVPLANVQEAALVHGIEVIGVSHLTQVIAYLRQEICLVPTLPVCPSELDQSHENDAVRELDFVHIKGNYMAKRALQIAAAGGHNTIFVGPPGSGKTMLAQHITSIMPPLTFDQMIECTKIYSVSGNLQHNSLVVKRPFRSPHHTISYAGLIGGGSYPQPGEISLAHNGILFLDELTEFTRHILETLRQPLEQKTVSISRIHQTVAFPAHFLLIAALNPCPCGFLGDSRKACTCTQQQIHRYVSKLSGPFLDRIDLQVHIQSIDYKTMQKQSSDDCSSAFLYKAIQKARARQKERFTSDTFLNSMIKAQDIEMYCPQTDQSKDLVATVFDALCLSMRGYHKLIKVARTIADLAGDDIIDVVHMQEAMMYRSLDRYLEHYRP